MKIQAALDCFTLEDALGIAEKISPYVDILEAGTPLMYSEGFRAVSGLKKAFPEKLVLADMKIVDAGYACAARAFDAGADIVTGLGMTNDATLEGVIRAAHERGKFALADTIGVRDLANRSRELDELGFDYIMVHTAFDLRDCIQTPIEALKVLKANVRNAKAGISGAITPDKMEEILPVKPDWIIVGGAFTSAADPAAVGRAFRSYM